LHPVKLTATEIEDEMQDLVNRARCIARKRSGEMPADAPTKVKRVRCLLDKGSCTAGKRSGELIAESSAKVKCVQNTSFAVTGESKLQACFTSGKRFEELIADSTSNTKRVQNPRQNNGKRSGELIAESSAKVKSVQNTSIAVTVEPKPQPCFTSGKRFQELIADATCEINRLQNPWQNNGQQSGELTAESSAKVECVRNTSIAVTGEPKPQPGFTSGKRFQELITDATCEINRVQNPWQNNGKRSGELTAESPAKRKSVRNFMIAVKGGHSKRFCYNSSACPCGRRKRLDVA